MNEMNEREYEEIRCQETVCPYGKRDGNRCCFGEIQRNRSEPIFERHKCKKGNLIVKIRIEPAA